jgi:hypothetical protein
MSNINSIKRTARNAVTAVKKQFSPNPPLPIVRFVAPKKNLSLNLITCKDAWQSAESQDLLTASLENAERILDIKLEILEQKSCEILGKFLLVGEWDGVKNYSTEVVSLLNKYGSKDRLSLLLANEIKGCQALAVLKQWAGKQDGLEKEGIILSSTTRENALSQILAKILSGKIGWQINDDPNNLICPLNNDSEDYLEPWRTATQNSSYLR